MTMAPVSLDDILAAYQRVSPYIHRTPLLTCQALSDRAGCDLRLKGEHLQRSGSFKIRGALNRLLVMTPEEQRRGVVAFSSGNHAQGVALAARLLGIQATIVMPSDAPRVKLDATRGYGAVVVEYDRLKEDREAIAQRLSEETGAVVVPPFNDPHVIAGQGTIGLELLADFPDMEVAVVPVGGGGLISGIATVLKTLRPDVEVVGVEPALADDARRSLAQGSIVRIPQPATVADGVATQSVGSLTFDLMRRYVDRIVTASEDEILDALELLLTRAKQVVEPTGALTTAAILSGRTEVTGRRVMSLLCGGNLDLALFQRERFRPR